MKVTNPGKVFFPDADGGPVTKLDLVRYWIDVADAALVGCAERPAILHRFPNGVADDGFYQKRLPEGRTGVGRVDDHHVPERPHRADAGHGRRRAPGLVGHARLPGGEPVAGPARRRRPSRRAADRPRSRPRRAVRLGPAGGARGPRGAERPRARRVPEDERQAGHPRERADRAALDVPRVPARRRRARAGDRTPGTRPRHVPVVEGGAARRVHRLQPERARPHRGVGVQRAADARRPRLGADRVGGGRRGGARGLHAPDDAGAAPRGGRPRRRDRRGRARLARAPPDARRPAGGGRHGRRAVAAALRQGRGRAAARRAVAPPFRACR